MAWIPQVCMTAALFSALSGCSVSPQPIPIHDDPALLVEIAYDPHAGTGHSHPAAVSTDIVKAVLRGLQLQGRDVIGTFGLLGEHHGTPAFTDRNVVAGLAPHLVAGLSKASPRDLVTFYLVQREKQQWPLITSGGMFLRNDHLYVILANGRTSPNAIQYETIYDPNMRSTPLLPIARYKFKTGFEPSDGRIATAEAKRLDGWEGYLDESKVVVVDLERLAKSLPPPSTAAPIAPPGIRP